MKITIFNSNVKSVLLHESKKIIVRLQILTIRRLLYILRVWWPRVISNGQLWQRTKKENIEFTIRRSRWRWIGHTLRKPATSIIRLSFEWS